MTTRNNRILHPRLHPVHGLLLAGAFSLLFIGVLSDFAYAASYQMQWHNFASWLMAGGLLCAAAALLWAIINLLSAAYRSKHFLLYTALLLLAWLAGFFNALIHARDAWAMMPAGLILSVLVMLPVTAATWLGFTRFGIGGEQ